MRAEEAFVRLRIHGALFLGVFSSLAVSLPALAADAGAKSVDAAWEKAMLAGNLDALLACYAPDAVMWLPNAPEARGTKAIREAYAGFFSTYSVTGVSIRNATYETRDSLSTGWGEFELRLMPKAGGQPTVMTGRFTALAKPLGDRWVYVVDHASTGAPPASGEKP
jgi:ketosteroid isomerase-like protein